MEPLNYRERRPPADSSASSNRQPLIDIDIDDVHTLAQGIVDTIRDPLLVLDQDLRVDTANRAFCQTFRMTRQNIEDRPVYALGDGQWNIPALRLHRAGDQRVQARVRRRRGRWPGCRCL